MLLLVSRYGAARILEVSPETVNRMYKRGELPVPHGMENRNKPLWLEGDIEDVKAKREAQS